MLLKLKKSFLWGSLAFAVTLIAAAATGVYYITRPLDLEFAQDPNAVEAHEANRKLKLLNEAQTTRRQGFIRLSEVEINSFLDGRYNNGKAGLTNGPVKLVKAGVLLGNNKMTFVTWHRAAILGFNLPVVWQRTVSPSESTNGWTFALQTMKVGALEIPEHYFTHIEKFLGKNDSLFEERMTWLKGLPHVTLVQNEVSKAPEFRLYSYVPKENAKAVSSD